MYRLTCLQLGPHGVAQLLNTIILHVTYDVLSSTSRYDLTNIQNLLACIGGCCWVSRHAGRAYRRLLMRTVVRLTAWWLIACRALSRCDSDVAAAVTSSNYRTLSRWSTRWLVVCRMIADSWPIMIDRLTPRWDGLDWRSGSGVRGKVRHLPLDLEPSFLGYGQHHQMTISLFKVTESHRFYYRWKSYMRLFVSKSYKLTSCFAPLLRHGELLVKLARWMDGRTIVTKYSNLYKAVVLRYACTASIYMLSLRVVFVYS